MGIGIKEVSPLLTFGLRFFGKKKGGLGGEKDKTKNEGR
jgi:hypothetical protein